MKMRSKIRKQMRVLNAALEAARRDAARQPCLLCNYAPSIYVGVWLVGGDNMPAILRVPTGKQRAVIYFLCVSCMGDGSLLEQKAIEIEKPVVRRSLARPNAPVITASDFEDIPVPDFFF